MDDVTTAFVFPAFEMKYAAYDVRTIEKFPELLPKALALLGDACAVDVPTVIQAYASADNYARLNDRQKHHLCYLSSTLLADIAEMRGLKPQWAAPYSMGLFASLYAARCLSFQDGFALMNHVCRTAHEVGRHRQGYGMGTVVGLSRPQVEKLITRHGPEVAVSDEMAERLIILSGKRTQLEVVIAHAIKDGAFHAKLLAVELPYHCHLMREARERIEAFVHTLSWEKPRWPIVACTDQRVLRTVEDVQREVSTNVIRPLSWRATMDFLLKQQGVRRFVECGFCENLSKMLKMTDKTVQVYHPKRFQRLDDELRCLRASAG